MNTFTIDNTALYLCLRNLKKGYRKYERNHHRLTGETAVGTQGAEVNAVQPANIHMDTSNAGKRRVVGSRSQTKSVAKSHSVESHRGVQGQEKDGADSPRKEVK